MDSEIKSLRSLDKLVKTQLTQIVDKVHKIKVKMSDSLLGFNDVKHFP